ncbi:MAG: flagellar hook capping protein [Armatimonadetes bacterium]|nr:flagellar hook capping protein [Armatimonadota bacterium]
MNPIDGITNNGAYGTVTQSKSDLDMNTFMRLLTVQLANQNPLEPMNDRDFFAQMAQLGQVQGLQKMQDSLELGQAASMIGHTVTAVRTLTESGENSLVTGVVQKVSIKDGERIMTVKDDNTGVFVDVKLANIREILR